MASPLVNQHDEGVPDDDDDLGDSMGEALEGARWRIEGEVLDDEEPDAQAAAASTDAGAASSAAAAAKPSSSSSSKEGRVEEGEPSDGIPSDADDADRARAAFLRRARAQSRKAASAANKAGLPFIPPAASRSAATGGGGGGGARGGRRLIRPRTRKESCLLCLRVCIRWPVLKHVLLSLLIPTLVSVALIYYHYFMPTSGLNFPQALIRGDDNTVRWFLRGEPALLHLLIPGDAQERFPLHVAALGNHTAMTRSLIAWGAALDATDGQGLTALHYTAHAGNLDSVLALLDAGANPHLLDAHRRSALHIASMLGHATIMQLLVYNAHVDPAAPDVDQRNAMDYSRIFHTHDPLQAIMQKQGPPQPANKQQQQRRTVTARSRSPVVSAEDAADDAAAEDEDYADVDASTPEDEVAESDDSVKSAARKTRLREKRARRERRQRRKAATAAAKAKAQASQPQHSSDPADDESDAALMSLFTDDHDDDSSASAFHRAEAESTHQRAVAHEFAELTHHGDQPLDDDEFAV